MALPQAPAAALQSETRGPLGARLLRHLLEPFVTAELEPAVRLVARRAVEAMGAGRCSIFLYDAARAVYHLTALAGEGAPAGPEPPKMAFPAGKLPAWVREMQRRGEGAVRREPSAPRAAAGGSPRLGAGRARTPLFRPQLPWQARPVLGVPLSALGEPVGLLFLEQPACGAFDCEQERLAALVGASLGPAVAAARDRAAATKELDLRNTGLALRSGLDRGQTLQMVAEMIVEMLGGELCLVLTFEAEDHMLSVRAASTSTGERVEASVSLAAGSLAARALEMGRPAWVEDGVEPPRLFPREWNDRLALRSGIAVPIREGSRATGVIVVYCDGPRRFSHDEAQVLIALAAQAGAALQSCAVFEHQREITETVRRSLVPQLPPAAGGVEFGHVYLPRKDRIGGDFYDAIGLPGGRLAIAMGDVSGSGLPAAVHTAMGKYMLRAFAFESPGPGTVLGKLNDAICTQSQSEVFLTLFYAMLHPSGQLIYSNGAHPYPLLRHAGGALTLLETTGTVVGIIPEQRYHERVVRVRPGDILLLYTDGITEAERHGERYGLERLQAVIRQWHGGHPQDLVRTIVRSVRDFGAGREHDDIAILAVRFI